MTQGCYIHANGQTSGPFQLTQVQMLAPQLPADTQVWLPHRGWVPLQQVLRPTTSLWQAPSPGSSPPAHQDEFASWPDPSLSAAGATPTAQLNIPDAPRKRGWSTGTKVTLTVAALLVAVVGIGTIAGKDQPSGTPQAVATPIPPASTAPSREPTAPAPQPTVTVTQTPTPTALRAAQPRQPTPKPRPRTVTVPDAEGMNYQRAQDLWRSRGLIVLPANDATGADRLAWIDSNWYVVSQYPKAGTQVRDGAAIRASIRKYTD